MGMRSGVQRGTGVVLLFMVCCALLTGCAQRLRAEVNAVVEQGYAARGQTFALGLLPGFEPEDPAAAQAALEAVLVPALQDMGYSVAAPDTPPHVRVRVWWFSTGPHPVYRTVVLRDRRHGFGRFGYRRRAVVVEDEYARYLVVEGILTAQAVQDAAEPRPLADSTADTMQPEAGIQALQEAARALPASPARLLWRVRVESRGNLSKADRVLMSLFAAAAPFMGKSGVLHVLVQDGEVVATEALP